MESSGMLLALLCASLVSVAYLAEDNSEDFGAKSPTSTEKELAEAMEVLLERFERRLPSEEKRGTIPLCSVGDRCAMRLGPRIGKLCDCVRGSNCNSFLLKCI